MVAFDTVTDEIIDVNPSAEALSGYSREELLGLNIAILHPHDERKRVEVELLDNLWQSSRHTGFHIQSKDGKCTPVSIVSSKFTKVNGRSMAVLIYFDISEHVIKEHQLSTQNWALSAYALVALALGKDHSTEAKLMQAICEAITQGSEYVLAWTGIAVDGPDKPIRIVASAGSALGYIDEISISWSEYVPEGQGPTGVCIRTSELQIMEDSDTSAKFKLWRERAREYGIRSCISIPFIINGNRHGALTVYSVRPKAFGDVVVEAFRHMAKEIGFGLHALEQERLLLKERKNVIEIEQQLTHALSNMVVPIVLAMEMRDPYTVGHQSRVAEIACAIGSEMGWSVSKLQGLRVAAQVHDIGKISIPAEILTKPGKLNMTEYEMLKEHVENGYMILKDIPFAWPIADIVRQHHEKLDGSGYPRGLKADAILYEAKVLAVADIVEAMVSNRPYRPGIKLYLALQEIEKMAGSQLDAEAVRICLDLFREKHFMVAGWIRD
jgi:PAS domain S-box-containing protein